MKKFIIEPEIVNILGDTPSSEDNSTDNATPHKSEKESFWQKAKNFAKKACDAIKEVCSVVAPVVAGIAALVGAFSMFGKKRKGVFA